MNMQCSLIRKFMLYEFKLIVINIFINRGQVNHMPMLLQGEEYWKFLLQPRRNDLRSGNTIPSIYLALQNTWHFVSLTVLKNIQ